MLPSKGAFIYHCNKAELCSSKIAPLEQIFTAMGEGIEFEHKRAMMNLLITHKLWTMTDGPTEMLGSVNGNTLTKSSNCITCGMKLVNFSLVYPIIGKAFHASNNNRNETILTQIRDRCFLLKVAIGQESKATMESFKDMNQFLACLTKENAQRICQVFPYMLPFKISRYAHHIAHRKCLKKGGT